MKIVIDPRVVELVRKKNQDSLTIWMEGCGGWGGGGNQPFVKMGKPKKDQDDYDLYEVDGIQVFVRVDVEPTDDVIYVDYYKILWIERISLRGIKF